MLSAGALPALLKFTGKNQPEFINSKDEEQKLLAKKKEWMVEFCCEEKENEFEKEKILIK